MEEEDKYRLRRNRCEIQDDLIVDDILDKLYSDMVIETDDMERVKSKTTSREKVGCLLDLLPSRGPEAYSHFRTALLLNYDWLVKSLDNTDMSLMKKPKDVTRRDSNTDVEHSTFCTVLSFADVLKGWKYLARELDVSEADIANIRHNNSNELKEQAYQMLEHWKQKEGKAATVEYLQQALLRSSMTAAAEALDKSGCQ